MTHLVAVGGEAQLYLLTLLLVPTACRRLSGAGAMLSVAALCLCVAAFYQNRYTGRELSLHLAHTEVAAFGIFLSGGLFLFLRRFSLPRLPAALYLLNGAVGAVLHWWSVPAGVLSLAGVAMFAVLINLLTAAPTRLLQMLAHPLLRKLGIWSFSIYIWQQPFYYLAHRGEISSVLRLCLGIGAGITSYYLVENPARNYLNRHWGVKKTPSAVNTRAAA